MTTLKNSEIIQKNIEIVQESQNILDAQYAINSDRNAKLLGKYQADLADAQAKEANNAT